VGQPLLLLLQRRRAVRRKRASVYATGLRWWEIFSFHKRFMFGSVAAYLAQAGSPISLSTACASGVSHSSRHGSDSPSWGDAMLCVATDGSVNPEALVRFSLLSALSTQNDPSHAAVRPFAKNRDGFRMAEERVTSALKSAW
jgi:3-oxoacyl-[acyl-carrier-protein] synthase II